MNYLQDSLNEFLTKTGYVSYDRNVEYLALGVRVQYNAFDLHAELNCSKDWDFENDCESENYLPGTCAVGAVECTEESIQKAIALATSRYPGEHVAIIAGTGFEHGDDPKEYVIKNAFVLHVIK